MKKRLFAFLFAVMMAVLLPLPTFANADMPPFLTVIVENPPEDLELWVELPEEIYENSPEEEVYLRAEVIAWETHYRFRGFDSGLIDEGLKLLVTTGGKTTVYDIPKEELEVYNAYVTLDLEEGVLLAGTRPGRTALLVVMRVSVTLLLEGLLFLLFRMKEKRSWVVFLCTNLVTQAALNIMVAGPKSNDYFMMLVPIIEIPIFIVEATAFSCLIREFREKKLGKKTASLFALLANLLSFIAGSWLLMNLPI